MLQPTEDIEGQMTGFPDSDPHQNLASAASGENESRDSDANSVFGEESSNYESLSFSAFEFPYENGRRYHRYRKGEYLLPNDEVESDRLDFFHAILIGNYNLILPQELQHSPLPEGLHHAPLPEGLHHAPLPKELHRVLDMGTGTGSWAIDMADNNPSAVLVGNDLSPIQPDWVPSNCLFYVDDYEMEWIFRPDEHFDYIHGRSLSGSVGDFLQLFRQAFRCMKPGGWLEMQEDERWIRSEDNSMEKAIWIKHWQQKMLDASLKFGKSLGRVPHLKKLMEDAGFVDVHEKIYKMPIGNWPKDPKLKVIGKLYQTGLEDSVEPYTLALFTRALGHTTEEVRIEIEEVRREIMKCTERNMHMYGQFYFVYGRKPGCAYD